MPKSIKTLSFIFVFNVIYMHSMECEIPTQKRLHDSEKEIILCTKKDPRLLLELPADILGTIVKYASPDESRHKCIDPLDLFSAIKLLIRFSWVCKKFERLSIPATIKATLNLNQKKLDFSLLEYGQLDITPFFELLVTMGANIHTHYQSIMRCLTFSSNRYLLERFLMLNPNANINEQNERGETPLRCAIDLNKPNIVKVLLEHNADMYLADNEGRTPTDMALLCDRIECLKALIEHGIDTTIKYDRNGLKLTIAETAELHATCDRKNAHVYNEIYRLITKEEISKPWNEKSVSEILNDTCIIS